jgi:hypothetical protein
VNVNGFDYSAAAEGEALGPLASLSCSLRLCSDGIDTVL